MPSIFRTFASITVWVLFIFGILSLIGGFIRALGASGDAALSLVSAYFGYGVLGLFLSVVCSKLRKGMD